jgi:hypothetical protein
VYYRNASNITELMNAVAESNNDGGNRYVIWLTSATYEVALSPVEDLMRIYGDVIIVRDQAQPQAVIRRISPTNYRLFQVFPQARLVLINIAIENFNWAPYAGGAIYNRGDLLIYKSAFTNNRGAGNGGAITSLTSLRIWNSAFTNNDAGAGGALTNQDVGQIMVQCTTFQQNSADYGGAIDGYIGGAITIHNSNFIGNTARFPQIFGMSDAIFNSLPPKPPIDATQNWWNAADGPRTPNRNAGGNSISLNVNFDPYVTTGAVNIQDPALCPEPPEVVVPLPSTVNFCISRPIDDVLGLNIRLTPSWGYNFVNVLGGRLRITGYYQEGGARWLRVDPYIDPQDVYTTLTGWVWEDVFQNPCDDGTSIDSLPVMDANGNIVAIPTPVPQPTPIPPPPTPEFPESCQVWTTTAPANIRLAWYSWSPSLLELEDGAIVSVYSKTFGGENINGSTEWYHISFERSSGEVIIGWMHRSLLDNNQLNSVCANVPVVERTLPPTNTPLPPSPTNTPHRIYQVSSCCR